MPAPKGQYQLLDAYILLSPLKEKLANEIREYVKILFDMLHLQSNNKQQVVTDGYSYLCEDNILGHKRKCCQDSDLCCHHSLLSCGYCTA